MKCGIKVNNRQCKNNVVSGLTIGVLDSVVYCCSSHYKKYANVDAINVPVYTSTKKVTPKEEIMNKEDMPFHGHCDCGGCTTVAEAEACHAEMVARVEEEINTTTKKEETMKTDIGIFTINYHEKGTVKCIKCSKELPISDPEGNWERGAFHSIEDLRKCLGAAPAPANPHNALINEWEAKDGTKMVSEWYANAHLANKRCLELRKGYVKPAKKGNGHWVHYAK